MDENIKTIKKKFCDLCGMVRTHENDKDFCPFHAEYVENLNEDDILLCRGEK